MKIDRSLDAGAAALDMLAATMPESPRLKAVPTGQLIAPQSEKSAKENMGGKLPDGYSKRVGGLYFVQTGEDGPNKALRVSSWIAVKAMSRGRTSEDWGRVVSFIDTDNFVHEWAIPMQMLAGDGLDVIKELLRLGLDIAPSRKAKTKLLEYLVQSKPPVRALCVQQTGWQQNVFVMPNQTIGQLAGASEKISQTIIFQSEYRNAVQYAQQGTVAEWRDHVGRLCIGNSRLIMACSAAFAGMVLHHANAESGGIHFVGSSSTGKSTAQIIAASVYGAPSFKQSWKATGNALEATCALHNDAALVLDEMAEVDPREIGSIVYMIGNGSGKGRAGRSGEAKQRKSWRVLIISSGEIGLAQHMRDGGKVVKAGQEVRMVDIAADAGAGLGLFENLHGHDGGARFADAIKDATQHYYGSPSITFLEYLTADLHQFPYWLKGSVKKFIADNLPTDAAGQVSRVCGRFALIAAAGEYATIAGITGWQAGAASEAAAACFRSWIASRGGSGDQERVAILSSVKAFFESHGESRFADINEQTGRVVINRAGFRKWSGDEQEFYVFTQAYQREVCSGYDTKTASKVLIEAGWLVPDNEGKATQLKRLPGMVRTRCYVFNARMWGVI